MKIKPDTIAAFRFRFMNGQELRATLGLATVFACRMLGLFMLMPLLAVYAKSLPGGNQIALVGLVLGLYGLTQALFYIPYGWLSDRLGRKPVILFGLLVFALGSIIAGCATTLLWVGIGRALQGAGAISSVVMALLADLTSDKNRTKAMAIVGSSIGLSFAIALVLAPLAFEWIGIQGIFFAMAGTAALSISIIVWGLPTPQPAHTSLPTPATATKQSFLNILVNPALVRLNMGVFILHASQVALFMTVPAYLVDHTGLPLGEHWKVYLPVMILSFIAMLPLLIIAEKYRKIRLTFLLAIGCLLISHWLLVRFTPTLTLSIIALWIYFTGFNVLEAMQPSQVSKTAPQAQRGAALGVYNTTQALGYFVGGAGGGLVLSHYGVTSLFLTGSALLIFWAFLLSVDSAQRRFKKA